MREIIKIPYITIFVKGHRFQWFEHEMKKEEINEVIGYQLSGKQHEEGPEAD